MARNCKSCGAQLRTAWASEIALCGACEYLELENQIAQLPSRTRSARLATLTPREEQILRARLGIGQPKQTLAQVREHFAVSRERIRQIQIRGMRKMCDPKRLEQLKQFL